MASNRYAGQCNMCSHAVPAGMGSIHRTRRTWIVYCATCVPGAMPGSTATTFTGAGGASRVYQNPAGYCIDAPCCGCCTI